MHEIHSTLRYLLKFILRVIYVCAEILFIGVDIGGHSKVDSMLVGPAIC